MSLLKCGIVGLPNVGKSTLFNALTKAKIAAENYPFCTIEPNTGIVEVPDQRLTELKQIVKPERIVPAIVEFVDIAGLVAGAATGEGLGNKFLAHIRETHAIAHVVRCFDDSKIIHVAGRISPIDDIAVINTELALADLATCDKALQRYTKMAKSDAIASKTVAVLQKCLTQLNQALPVSQLNLDEDNLLLIAPMCFITAKPSMYIANTCDTDLKKNEYFEQLCVYAEKTGAIVVPVCAAIESEIADLDEADKELFLAELNLSQSSLDRVIQATYKLLGLHTYFTAGVKEVRAWTIALGTTAPKAAGVIHTDFEKGFIRAQTISFADFIRYNGEQGAKEAGKVRAEGKDYIVRDGDVLNFLYSKPSL